ncbi:desumoylating isopeptidase 1 [Nematocida homosporus]|uniref:desumoylating isopeptidase 1 n=1 Tax=Nematocida homosporus TaxID=1912981 RepID=UPI00222022AF|nr:desumoylating isopeptidase 1 [Nematocida homosporus]KAI5186425.1 desumoylating isopeptidase 1 [Nematocida homosporus]
MVRSVEMWVYDISNPGIRSMLELVLGIKVTGIWHTSVVVFGREYYFQSGIRADVPGSTPFGTPVRKEAFGESLLSSEEFDRFLLEQQALFSEQTYDLLENNCNHFSDVVLKCLVGRGTPEYVMALSDLLKGSPLAKIVKTALGSA